MDPYFRQTHGSGPSPHEESSPRSATSQYRNFTSTSGLDRLLQSPQDMSGLHRYSSKGLEGYNSSSLKREETKAFDSFQYAQQQASGSHQTSTVQGQTGKRGSKACVACMSQPYISQVIARSSYTGRKGKNRCEGDPSGQNGPCRRCLLNNIPCVYEKAGDRGKGRASTSGPEAFASEAEGRVSHLENSVRDLAQGQNQIQNAVSLILHLVAGITHKV